MRSPFGNVAHAKKKLKKKIEKLTNKQTNEQKCSGILLEMCKKIESVLRRETLREIPPQLDLENLSVHKYVELL